MSGNSKAYKLYHFLKELSKIFQVSLKYFSQTVTDVLLSSAENNKLSNFCHFNNHNSVMCWSVN